MPEKNCKQILQYLGDVIDDRSDKAVSSMFFEHIAQCQSCKNKYEIALKVKELLADDQPKTDEAFTAAVMDKINNVGSMKIKKSRIFYFRTIASAAAAIVLIVASVIFAVTWKNTNIIDDSHVQTSQKDSSDQTVPFEQSASFINDNFLKPLDENDKVKVTDDFTGQGILDILKSVMMEYVSGEYKYIAFITVSDIDAVNKSAVIDYVPNSEKNGVYFYSTNVSSDSLINIVKDKLKQDCIIDSNKNAEKALILVRVVK